MVFVRPGCCHEVPWAGGGGGSEAALICFPTVLEPGSWESESWVPGWPGSAGGLPPGLQTAAFTLRPRMAEREGSGLSLVSQGHSPPSRSLVLTTSSNPQHLLKLPSAPHPLILSRSELGLRHMNLRGCEHLVHTASSKPVREDQDPSVKCNVGS